MAEILQPELKKYIEQEIEKWLATDYPNAYPSILMDLNKAKDIPDFGFEMVMEHFLQKFHSKYYPQFYRKLPSKQEMKEMEAILDSCADKIRTKIAPSKWPI